MYLDIGVEKEGLDANLPRAHSYAAEILRDPAALLTLAAHKRKELTIVSRFITINSSSITFTVC